MKLIRSTSLSLVMCVLDGEVVARYCSSYTKINPNGVDLTPKEVRRIPDDLTIYFQGAQRGYLDRKSGNIVEIKKRVLPNDKGFYSYARGGLYELRFPEIHMPPSCTGFVFPRSTINRLGIIKLESAVFDSGYCGEPTQTIFTPLDAIIHKDEALIQMVFIRNEKPASKLYKGYYQHEKSL